jgi:mono/diheme cytochrome c family protein
LSFWKGFALGFVIALVFISIGAYVYFAFGYAPVSTASKPMPFETALAHRGLRAAIGAAADKPSPVQPTEPNLASGAAVYRQDCAVCHGLPGEAGTHISRGMFPKPPQLFRGKGVTDDPVGETFWKVQNGIRLTGMPGFQGSLSEQQMWQVSQLLAHSHDLPESVSAELKRK